MHKVQGLTLRFVLAAFFAFLMAAAPAQQYPHEYASYDIKLDLHKNGNLDVQETLETVFNEERHGIIRTIPVDYPTGSGLTRRVSINNISVTDKTGNPYTTKISRSGSEVSIRIGDADILLPAGTTKTYVIRYTASGAVNWFGKTSDWEPYAELYWNAMGDQVDTVTHVTNVVVNFPDVGDPRQVRARVFVGPYGSRNQQTAIGPAQDEFSQNTQTSLSVDRNRVVVSRDMPLPPYEGITVVVNVPAKTIDQPTLGQKLNAWLLPNLGFGIPILVLILMPILFYRYGKDPDSGPMVVQFDPPDGLSGSEIGAFLDERVDTRDIVAGIFSLAVNGYLTIVPKEVGMVFKKRSADLELTGKEAESDLSAFEKKLLSKLKRAGPTVTDTELRTHVAPYIMDLKNTLFQCLVERGYYTKSPAAVRATWMVGGLLVIIGLAVIAVAISPFHDVLPSIVGGFLGFGILAGFAMVMPRRTAGGAKKLALAKGFEEFVRRARSDEFRWMEERHPDALLFEKYLPHAVALGLTAQWAKAFEGIVTEMPTWYATPYGTPFHPMYFAMDLDSVTNSLGSSATVPPRSDGASGGSSAFSGGGGFSGGGFGGGGSSSW